MSDLKDKLKEIDDYFKELSIDEFDNLLERNGTGLKMRKNSVMVKCIECKYYISDDFCRPYKEEDYDFEINGEYSEHNCPHFILRGSKGLGELEIGETMVKSRIVKSKCMADMLVWLGFEYKKTDKGYIFQRDRRFDRAWKDVHSLRQRYRD